MELKTILSMNRDNECPLDGCNDPLTQNTSQEFQTLRYTLFLAERGTNDVGEIWVQSPGRTPCPEVHLGPDELGTSNASNSDHGEDKLNSLIGSADLSTMEAKKVETRNREPSCTFHSLSWTQIHYKGVPILAYLCP